MVTGTVSGSSHAGLLAAYNTGTIENCAADGSVTGSGSSTNGCTGGLVGYKFENEM